MTSFNQVCNESSVIHSGGLLHLVLEKVRKTVAVQQLRMNVRREREVLKELTDDQLRDIGISRRAALTEAARHDLPTKRIASISAEG
jgi:uncharacterized protein YjiS (DUF1127 family)